MQHDRTAEKRGTRPTDEASARLGTAEAAEGSATCTEWPGLPAWRAAGADRRRRWAGKKCEEVHAVWQMLRVIMLQCIAFAGFI